MLEALDKSKPRESAARRPPGFSLPGEILLTLAVTAALLVPCFWQQRIQAGDLSSHRYNAWLAGEIRRGAVEGLTIVPAWTNVLCDWAFETLPRFVGTRTEQVVVGAAVLVFFWGAFCLLSVTTGRHPWLLAPILAMLTYGLVFHFGFMNFYVSTGLSMWIVALLWHPTWLRAALAIPLVALTVVAHLLPLAWAASLLLYIHIWRRTPKRWRPLLPLGALAGLLILQAILTSRYTYRSFFEELKTLSGVTALAGVDQVWLYGPKFLIVSAGLVLIWCLLFLERLDEGGMLADPVVHLWLLHLAALVLLPAAILFPQYQHGLIYIPQRISLWIAILLCMVVGRPRYGRGITRFSSLIALAFFTFLYLDDRALNLVENEVTDLASTLPPGSRFVAEVTDSDTRLNALLHVADRACIGRCFSYANYEPATGQFRIHVLKPNRAVAAEMSVVQDIENRRHTVTPQEAPLYSVCPCETPGRRFCLRALKAGETTCNFSLPVSPRLWTSRAETPGGRQELAREDQCEVPDHQRGVPIVDQPDHLDALAPDANAAQQERHQL